MCITRKKQHKMKQDFQKAKKELIESAERGDMAEAARIAGVSWPAFRQWVLFDGVSTRDKRNMVSLKKAIAKREKGMRAAMAA